MPLRAFAATEAELGLLADSVAWQAHFESWIERFLIRTELEGAREALPALDPDASYRVMLELTEDYVRALDPPRALPQDVTPRVAARGLSGEAIRIARLYVMGDREAALEALEDPTLERDAHAAHLRAQLLDERARAEPAWQKLRVIQEYRLALSLDRTILQAARARLRIAQLYLEIGFLPEALAALRPHLDPPLPRPYDAAAALTFSEIAARAGDPRAALDALDAVPDDHLLTVTLPWVLRRRAELLFELREYEQAAVAYDAYVAELHDQGTSELDLVSAIRFAYAQLRSGEVQEARTELAVLYERPDPEDPAELVSPPPSGDATAPEDGADTLDSAAENTGDDATHPNADGLDASGPDPALPRLSLVGLLRVQAEAQDRRFAEMQDLAQQVLAAYPRSPEAPILATAVLEAQQRRGGNRSPPPGLSERIDFETSDPAVALLSYKLETQIGAPEGSPERLDRLASLARQLPEGPVQALVHDAMAHEMLQRVREEGSSRRPPDASLLDLMEQELSARQMEENGLLLALEAFRQAGRLRVCVRWALALRERERRPIRRGIGAWREHQCRRHVDPEPPTQKDLASISDSGEAGPFSLAFAALAGEMLLRQGELEGAVRIYERGLESFAEPQIVGPVLLRLGELHTVAGRDGLARQRLERGLGVTDRPETAADPLRKLGMIALATLVQRHGDGERLRFLLTADLERTDPWWPSAYRFLGRRAGLKLTTPEGSDPFVRGDEVLGKGRALLDRLAAIAARKPPAASGDAP